ncbi:PAS domain-containing sensor histidine kinase [Rhizobium sp. EC-SD404]|uniref:sensor histidine kinase n=1 Tax=Rhizobium sp. EC-SD404 TaxID=2038389 RepID=UPI001256BA27|nr:PAS domain-containing sensor histidine kinase [Rhizobium sp. EC-SD404]VVT32023.1 Cell-division control histidine kinase PdhS [Rhizobium sp. EC-SD404]
MPAHDYPFIEIAVHPSIRERYSEGAGLAVLSPAVDYVYWANGAAATQFGYESIYTFLEDEAFEEGLLARQVATAAGRVAASGQAEKLILRVGSGFRRVATACVLEPMTLSGGEPALLLAMPPEKRLRDSIHRAQAMISGFGDTDTHVAVLDGDANMLAQSMTFDGLQISPDEMVALVESVDREPGRLIKRAILTAHGTMPAAIARIGDSQPLNLIFVVEPAIAAAPQAPLAAPPAPVEAHSSAADASVPAPSQSPEASPPSMRPYPHQVEETVAHAPAPPTDPSDEATGAGNAASGSDALDRFEFDITARPVRFAWKIDSGGLFSEVSPEFGKTIGPNAADIVGRSFEDVATVFNLDPERKIIDLLHRRDTWSSKTVMWPVQGTPLVVPVDLAALPTYSRDRAFEGFRGFGIVRVAEAVEDAGRLGLSLTPQAKVSPTPQPFTPEASPLPELPTIPTLDVQDPVIELPLRRQTEESPPATIPVPSNDDTAPPASNHREPDPIENPLEDPFRGEVPALRIVETPARRSSDKVIDLDEHRSRGREGLSKIDQAVFHQIGEELGRRLANRDAARKHGADANQNAAAPAEAKMPASVAPPPPAEPVTAVELVARALPTAVPKAEHVAAIALPEPNLQVVEAKEETAVEPLASDAERTAPDGTEVAPEPSVEFASEAPRRPGRTYLTAAFIDALPAALAILRGERMLHANSNFLSLTGYAGSTHFETSGGLDALFLDMEDSALSAVDPATKGLRLMRLNGDPIEVDAKLQSVGWDDGSALLLALAPLRQAPPADTGQDRRTVASSAEIEMEELRSILETATDGVVILDEDGSIRSMNRSASALFDYESDETLHQPFAMLFAHESQRAVLDYVASLSDNGVASVLNDGREVIGREASGGFIPLFMTLGRLRGSNGYCAVMRDITHWKRTEEELRAAKRSAETANAHKSEFLARVSHEIRTPLNAIIGFSEMMSTERFGPLGSARYLEYAHDIGRSGRHVLDIVNDLLDISKIEAGQQDMDFSAVSLNELLAEAVSLLQPQANAERVIIRTSLSTALPDVVADPRSVKQIAINLLANAVRFTPPGGQIVVSTVYDAGGKVVMRVRDTGIGMSRSELDHAMKPFRQGPTSPMRPRGDGTGLGLPLTKAMVEANRAHFAIESAPGEGTLVQVTFPSQRVLAD